MLSSQIVAQDLTQNSVGFLSDVLSRDPMPPETIMLQCGYDVGRFRPESADQMGIALPERLATAVEKRKAEFTAGRLLARTALDTLDNPAAGISMNEDRSPDWPGGVQGAITHSHGQCACIVSRHPDTFVGVDIERLAQASSLDAILRMCVAEDEHYRIHSQDAFSVSQMATLIFSAKETLFKMLYPLVQEYFDFLDASFQAVTSGSTLGLRITRDLPGGVATGMEFDVRFEMFDKFVLTWGVETWPGHRAT